MAMAFTTQSVLAKPVLGHSTTHSSVPSHTVFGFAPRVQKKSAGFQVSCMFKKDMSKATPSPEPKVSTKFSDVFAFGGPAPERINGRLAMIGFTAAMAVELSRGSNLFVQISDGGLQWFIGTSVLLSLASLIPLFKGVSVESKSDGVMTSDAELWNGRFAMLGLVALAFTEFVTGSALV